MADMMLEEITKQFPKQFVYKNISCYFFCDINFYIIGY